MKIKSLTVALLVMLLLLALASAQNITREDTIQAIQQAEQDMYEMVEAGFAINSVNDSLIAARQALERADFAELIRQRAIGEVAERAKQALEGLNYKGFTYDGVLKYTQEIATRKQQAYALLDSFRAFELELESYKEEGAAKENASKISNIITGFFVSQESQKHFVDTSEADTLLIEARKALEKERYKEANNLLLQAQTNLEEKQKEITTTNIIVKSGKSFIEKNWIGLSILTVFIVISGWLSWKKIKIKRIRDKLKKLKIEQKSLLKLMKKTQEERFKKGKISELIYNIRMEKYNKRLNEVKQMMPVLKARLKKKKSKRK